ncbi:hypothetical protein BKH46_08815 [Helicobacter sp. 12S02634-8]|uniref:phage baseplate assembly protein V n=1 Tax=Helicobacter sp. 12S02634-8 TaxID=1476199 RepID=UPI000BA5A7C0|nr:phage baseplate assembly protein V [Helicobacter sp. 12S02634-8]PAF46138.1 hypothetical protein BKH46_08815 [Helicobacter sp. 12S02634-8]
MFGETKIYLAPIIEVKGNQVSVDILGAKTDFIPYLALSNAFKSHFIPPKKGEMCVIFHFLDSGLYLALGSIPRPISSKGENQERIEYSDGTILSYDTQEHTLSIESQGKITIVCKEANIKSDEVKIECKNAEVKGDNINLGGIGGGGVVTTQCICPFTGAPHAQGSSKVKAIL